MIALTPEAVLDVLRVRKAQGLPGLSGVELFGAVVGRGPEPGETRQLRAIICQLRLKGHEIAATPESGYALADSPEELLRGMRYLRSRALKSLIQINRQRRRLGELAGQLSLSLNPATAALNSELTMTSILAEIPDELHGLVSQWVEAHPSWDCNRVYKAALALFLMQDRSTPGAIRAYLEATFQEPDHG